MRRTAKPYAKPATAPRLLRLFLVCCLSLLPAMSKADDFLARLDYRDFLDRFDSAMEESPPDFADIVPGTDAAPGATRLLIADFTARRDDPDQLMWALADVLRHDIALVAPSRLVMPFYATFPLDRRTARGSDRDPFPDAEMRQRLVRMWNADWIVEGEWQRQGDAFRWIVVLRETGSEGVNHTREWKGPIDELPAALAAAVRWIPTTLGMTVPEIPADAYAGHLNAAALARLGRFLIESEKRYAQFRRAHAITAWENGLPLPAVGRALLNSLDFHDVSDETLHWLDTVGSTLHHPEIRARALRLQAVYGPSTERAERIRQLQALVRRHPGNPGLLYELARAFSDGGRELTGIGVSLELLRRQPAMAQSWASVARSLLRYGWSTRGESYWRHVPENAKRRFLSSLRLASLATERCLARAPSHPPCLVDRMQTLHGYSDELITLFEEAISVDPHYRRAYVAALNFTMPVWGGSLEHQAYVLERARQHNPDAEWIEKERDHLAPDVPGRWRRHLFWIGLAIFTVAIGGGLLYLRRRND